MTPIICKNNLSVIIDKIQECLNKNGNIKGIRLVDQTNDMVAILVDEQKIDDHVADAFWAGYNAAFAADQDK